MKINRPDNLPPYASLCLQTLADNNLGHTLSLGGAFGLMHYFEYRSTYDVDAWWQTEATSAEQQQVVSVLETALEPFGAVRTRVWGDVVSVELKTDAKKAFSFQIAHRSSQLEPSIKSPWQGILLDSFNDLIASKTTALVERGAPRDFLDIYTLCQEGLVTSSLCWVLWRQRQLLAGSDAQSTRARLAIQTHLARIEQHRPLKTISDEATRTSAEKVRAWYKTEFIDALDD